MQSFKITILFCVYVLCLQVNLCITNLQRPQEQERVLDLLRLELSVTMWFLGLNPDLHECSQCSELLSCHSSSNTHNLKAQ